MKINYYSANDNLSGRWYVRITDYINGKRKNYTFYSDLNQDTLELRHLAAKKKVSDFETLAAGGWHPEKNVETFVDSLAYHKAIAKEKVNYYDIRSIANDFLAQFCVGKRKKTIQQRTCKLRCFVEWCEKNGIVE